jgi:hypothetical protein
MRVVITWHSHGPCTPLVRGWPTLLLVALLLLLVVVVVSTRSHIVFGALLITAATTHLSPQA